MTPLQQHSRTPSDQPGTRDVAAASAASLPIWRLNVMRVGYAVMVVGLAARKWPEFLANEPWEL
jgi:hypothetical protein